MAKPKVIAVANQKGGVGKSTSVYNIGAGLAMNGKNILLIDDIYTSGSTMEHAAGILKRAGVQNVYFLTVSIGQER